MIVITEKERNKLCAMEEITSSTVRDFFQNYSSGKIKKPKVGKLSIVNACVPDFKDSTCNVGLLKIEGDHVFYALEKLSFGLFSKSAYRMFIWKPLSNEIFTVPVESVKFEKPVKNANGTLYQEYQVVNRAKRAYVKTDKGHTCYQDGIEVLRQFSVEDKKISAVKDFVVYYLQWDKTDQWVEQHFTQKVPFPPMYCLRNETPELGFTAYPKRP